MLIVGQYGTGRKYKEGKKSHHHLSVIGIESLLPKSLLARTERCLSSWGHELENLFFFQCVHRSVSPMSPSCQMSNPLPKTLES